MYTHHARKLIMTQDGGGDDEKYLSYKVYIRKEATMKRNTTNP